MRIAATLLSTPDQHLVEVRTRQDRRTLTLPQKVDGRGSAVNGGELLLLALATCYCNDLYREAAKRKLVITHVEVEAAGEFSAEGAAGHDFTYRVEVKGTATDAELDELVRHTDTVAEIQNTLRQGVAVQLLR